MSTRKEWFEMFGKRAKELEQGGEFTYRYYGGKYVYKFRNNGQTPDSAKEFKAKYYAHRGCVGDTAGMATFLKKIFVLSFVNHRGS